MEAVLKIKSSEFTDELIGKLKALIGQKQDAEITISVTDDADTSMLRSETKEAYFKRLGRALDNEAEGNVVAFSGDSMEQFFNRLTTL